MMPFIFNETLHSPHFIFVQSPGSDLPDDVVLNMFQMDQFRLVTSVPDIGHYVFVRREKDWLHIADGWHYILWSTPSTRNVLLDLSKTHVVYQCAFGDCDESYEFRYYSNGAITREMVVESPEFSDRKVVCNTGMRLPGERAAFFIRDGQRKVLHIAKSIGITTTYAEQDVRVYASPNAEWRSERQAKESRTKR